MRPRLVACLAAAVLLVGCRGSADIAIQPDASAVVDAVLIGADVGLCDPAQSTDTWTFQELVEDGQSVCRIHGVARANEAGSRGGFVLRPLGEDEVLFAVEPDTAEELERLARVPMPSVVDYESVDLRVTFPGQVVATEGGSVSGTTVTWHLPAKQGLAPSAVGRLRPRPPTELVAGLTGAAVGAALAGAVVAVVRRRRT